MKTTKLNFLVLMFVIGMTLPITSQAYDFRDSGINYNILSEEDRTVEVARNDYEAYVSVSIPTKVYFNSKLYTVTKIGDKAFYSCQQLTSVDIPASVTTIGERAFFTEKVIEKIYCHWKQPIEPKYNIFSDDGLNHTKLYVPIDTKTKYEKVDPWRNFWNIIEGDYEAASSIDDVLESNRPIHEEIERFDINGKLVSTDYKGLLIIRNSEGTTRKMIVK